MTKLKALVIIWMMNYSVLSIMAEFGKYVLPVIVTALALCVGTPCIVFAIKLIKRQIKLYNSITLVELKSTKLYYLAFAFISSFAIIFTFFQMLDPSSPETIFLAAHFSMSRLYVNLTLGATIALLLSFDFLMIVLARSKCAVVDRGVHTATKYLDWYHVHDYLIDEEKCIVILTSSKETFSSLEGTTPPLKVAKNDIAKLKFILNKNKNRFSNFEGNI